MPSKDDEGWCLWRPHIITMWNPLILSQCGIPLTFSQCRKAIRFLVGEVALTLSQCGKALGFLKMFTPTIFFAYNGSTVGLLADGNFSPTHTQQDRKQKDRKNIVKHVRLC